MSVRTASHAGSWYTSSEKKLASELEGWLGQAHEAGEELAVPVPVGGCKAVIAPHAGYSYSGPAAAWAYKTIDPTKFNRVVVLGPSHHVYLDGCALSKCKTYATPVGDLPLDLDAIAELKATGKFEEMSLQTDEDEHSIELHLPYIRHVFQGQNIKIVPILIGSISASKELQFGSILAPIYLTRLPSLSFQATFATGGALLLILNYAAYTANAVLNTRGTRFSYTYYRSPSATVSAATSLKRNASPPNPPIHVSISALDHRGMEAISLPAGQASKNAKHAHEAFTSYLKETTNTICGRHPIGVLLGAVAALQTQPSSSNGWEGKEVELKFVRYEHSSQCVDVKDSSVSYASAFLRLGQ